MAGEAAVGAVACKDLAAEGIPSKGAEPRLLRAQDPDCEFVDSSLIALYSTAAVRVDREWVPKGATALAADIHGRPGARADVGNKWHDPAGQWFECI